MQVLRKNQFFANLRHCSSSKVFLAMQCWRVWGTATCRGPGHCC